MEFIERGGRNSERGKEGEGNNEHRTSNAEHPLTEIRNTERGKGKGRTLNGEEVGVKQPFTSAKI